MAMKLYFDPLTLKTTSFTIIQQYQGSKETVISKFLHACRCSKNKCFNDSAICILTDTKSYHFTNPAAIIGNVCRWYMGLILAEIGSYKAFNFLSEKNKNKKNKNRLHLENRPWERGWCWGFIFNQIISRVFKQKSIQHWAMMMSQAQGKIFE